MAGEHDTRARERRFERREVRSDDPSLSDDANRRLTEEAREAIGTDEVVVPAGAPRHDGRRRGAGSPYVASLAANRTLLLVTFLAALVVGAIIALVTNAWWAVVLAGGVHALGTVLIAAGAIQLTTETEHVSPGTAAALEDEGVTDPDQALSELVEDFSGEQDARGTAEVVSSGHNERTVLPEEDPVRSAAEQRTAMTPSSEPSAPAGEGSTIAGLPWVAVLASMAASAVLPLVADNAATWIAPAIVWPAALAWLVLWLRMDGRGEERGTAPSGPARPAGDVRQGMLLRLVPVLLVVVTGVCLFLAGMGLILEDL